MLFCLCLALFSIVLAAPNVTAVAREYGLVSTLGNDCNLKGYRVFSKQDGTLWLDRPSRFGFVEMLGAMDLNGNVVSGTRSNIGVNDSGALALGKTSDPCFVIDVSSVLSTPDGNIAMSGCPNTSEEYELFLGTVSCVGCIDVALRAVSGDDFPLLSFERKLDTKQNLRCTLLGCLKCGGCLLHRGCCGCHIHPNGRGAVKNWRPLFASKFFATSRSPAPSRPSVDSAMPDRVRVRLPDFRLQQMQLQVLRVPQRGIAIAAVPARSVGTSIRVLVAAIATVTVRSGSSTADRALERFFVAGTSSVTRFGW